MRKNEKRQVAVFITSFLVTACVISLVFSMALVHKNTSKVLENSPSQIWAIEREEGEVAVVLAGRKFTLSTRKLNDFLKSRAVAGLGVVWLLI